MSWAAVLPVGSRCDMTVHTIESMDMTKMKRLKSVSHTKFWRLCDVSSWRDSEAMRVALSESTSCEWVSAYFSMVNRLLCR